MISVCLSGITSEAAFISDWALESFENASSAGIICHSVAAGDLKGNITRSEFCELSVKLYDILGGSEISGNRSENPFSDCDNKAVVKAYGLGIVSGVGGTIFDPDKAVTREEMSKMIVSAVVSAGIAAETSEEDMRCIDRFADRDKISSWAEKDMAFLVKNNIISGVSENTLMPGAYATREQAIVIVERVLSAFCSRKERSEMPRIISADGTDGVGISWTEISGANTYRVLLKRDGKTVSDAIAFDNNIKIKNSRTEDTKGLSAVVEAVMSDGTSIFGMPYEFDENVVKTPAPAKRPDTDDNNSRSETEKNDKNEDNEKVIELHDRVSPVTLPVSYESSGNTADYKKSRVFNGGEPFATEEEADANMTEIEVDVWHLSDTGGKVAA
ncbi:MAG: S-layer homology domain-containing protein, partial [Oscillospiraceae bacterium]|nr:S-layer homology domain-containing protein [Oscillospiraceae bacterium]